MSCSDNIQFLRKRRGLTQEQFAEALGVTRQSVSKWESGQSYPEMEKLLQMCELFGCDLETLVRGSADAAASEDDAEYEPFMNAFSRAIAGGVALILLGVTLLVGLGMIVGEEIMTMVFLGLLTVAVLIFVLYGIRMESFRREHPRVGALYSTAECRRANNVFAARLCVGIGAILLGVIACVGIAEFGAAAWGSAVSEYAAGAAVLVGVTIGAPLIVYGGLQKSKYDIAAYNRENKPRAGGEPLSSRISGAIMLTATAIFLACGFIWDMWHPAWAVFPIGGILCGIVSTLMDKGEQQEKEERADADNE